MKLNILFVFALIVVAMVVGAKAEDLTAEQVDTMCNQMCTGIGSAQEEAECQTVCHEPDDD